MKYLPLVLNERRWLIIFVIALISCHNSSSNVDSKVASQESHAYKASDSIAYKCLDIVLEVYTSIEVRDIFSGGMLLARNNTNNQFEIFTGSKIKSEDSMVVDLSTFEELEHFLNLKSQVNDTLLYGCLHELKSIFDTYMVSRYYLANKYINSNIMLIPTSEFASLSIPVKLPYNCELSFCAVYSYKSEQIYIYSYTNKQSFRKSNLLINNTKLLYIYNPRYKLF